MKNIVINSNDTKYEKSEGFLPIGFMPSNVLINVYLQFFDNMLQEYFNPIEYGRYVDDIGLVIIRSVNTHNKTKQIKKLNDLLSQIIKETKESGYSLELNRKKNYIFRIKLFNEGVINEAIVDIIRSNVRFPDQSLGDMWAQISALKMGEKRLVQLCDRYSKAVVKESIHYLLDHGETIARQAIKKLPNGTYEAKGQVDSDGLGHGPFLVKVKVTIADEKIKVDFSGSAVQAPGPINLTYSGLVAAVRSMFLSIVAPDQDVNDGIFEPLEIIADPKSIMAAEKPAPVSNYFITFLEVVNVIQAALVEVIPDKLIAGHYAAVCSVVVGGIHPDTHKNYLLVEPTTGGWGAMPNADGQSGQFCYGNGETFNIPIEVIETRYGIRVGEYSLRVAEGDAGAGEYIGGFGTIRSYEALHDQQTVTTTLGHHESRPWGVSGGSRGSTNDSYVKYTDGKTEGPDGIARYTLNKGDLLILKTGTGGGYGDPFKRPVKQVVKDVKNGYISAKTAAETFGVKVDEKTFAYESVRKTEGK